MNTTKLRALLEAATPGPWLLDESFLGIYTEDNTPVALDTRYPDANLIVEMRNSLPALLDRLDKLEAVVEAAREAYGLAEGMAYMPLDKALAVLDAEVGE